MRWRVLGGAVVLALVGGAAGYAVGAGENDEPEDAAPTPVVADLEPVPADPTIPVKVVESDPKDPTLEPAIALGPELLVLDDAKGKPKYELRLPVPVGWNQTPSDIDPARWTYTVPGNSTNTYGLRVQILAAEGQSLVAARDSRIAALNSTETQGNMSDLEFEDEPDNGFTATFIDSGGFRRVNIERFFGGADPTQAFATVALYGREQDRMGMEDLLDRIAIDLRTEEK